jgi:hypothetical protein
LSDFLNLSYSIMLCFQCFKSGSQNAGTAWAVGGAYRAVLSTAPRTGTGNLPW